MNFIQGYQNELLIIGGAVIVMFLAIEKFDTWPASNGKDEGAQPPRSFTTFGRYLTYCSLYVFGFEVIYLIFTFFPNITRSILGSFDIQPNPLGGEGETGSSANFAPLWALSALVAILSAPVSKAIEPMIRKRVHRRAAIKSAAEHVVRMIQFHDGIFRPDPDSADRAIEALGVKHLEPSAGSERQTSISHKWFRAIYLFHALEVQTDPAFGHFLSDGKEEFSRIERYFRSMKEEMDAFLKQRGKSEGRAPERWGRSLEKGLDDLLGKIYLFIVCGAYKTRKSNKERKRLLEGFGIFLDTQDRIPFAADVVVKSILAIAISALVPTVIYLILLQDVVENTSLPDDLRTLVPKNQWWAMYWVIAGLLMHGMAMCAVVIAWRWYAGEGDRGKPSRSGATASGVAVMGVLGYGVSLLVLFGVSVLAGIGLLGSLLSSLMWSLVAAVTSGFTFVYVVRAVEEIRPRPIKDIALHSSVMAGVSLFLCLFVPGALRPHVIHLWFAAYVMAASILIGGGIAYVFPSGYFRHLSQVKMRRHQEALDAAYENLTKMEREYGVGIDNYFLDDSAEDEKNASSFVEQYEQKIESDLEKIKRSAYEKSASLGVNEDLESRIKGVRDYLGPRLVFIRDFAKAAKSAAG